MMHESGEKWRTWAAKAFLLLVALAGAWLLMRYAVGILLPFLIAWGLGAMVYPAAARISKRTRLPRGLCAAVLLLLLLVLISLLLTAVVNTLLFEIRQLLTQLEADEESLGRFLSEWGEKIRRWSEGIPILGRLRRVEGLAPLLDEMNAALGGMVREMLSVLSRRIPEWIGRLVRAVPSAVIFTVVMLIAGFYFSTDLEGIRETVRRLLPAGVRERLSRIRDRLSRILRQYARAYLLLLTVTFLELYVAFSVLGIDYAFLTAALVALIDILPVLGGGIVLLPWAAVLLIGRQYFVGIGLLVTYGIVTVVRQILEPRVVSGALGLHPLLTLFCMYGGYRLFGIIGMMLAPAAVIFLSSVVSGRQSSSRSGA